VLHLSGGELAIVIALSFLWAALGYRLSENDRRNLGRTPWGLPSLVWALFWFLSLILGFVLYLIAHSSGVRRAQHSPPAAYPDGGGAPPVRAVAGRTRAMSVAEQFPAYPQPANLQPPRPDPGTAAAPESDEPSGPPPAAGGGELLRPDTASPEAWTSSPPAWHPDPSGRFHFRWWDGHQWTSQVSIDGHHLIDTNPDQRIGPY
jgi:hypothetical protein